jgi:hypothetical protein
MSKYLFAFITLLASYSLVNAGGVDKVKKYPVRWYGSFKHRATLNDIDKTLKAPWDSAFKVYKYDNKKSKQKKFIKVCNCKDFFLAYYKGMEPLNGQNDYYVYLSNGLDCFAAQAILKAKPSDYSYIEGLKIDRYIARCLPSEMSLVFSPENETELKLTKNKRKSWAEYDEITGGMEKDDAVELFAKHSGHRVEKLATGDFNEDGIEDIMLLVNHWPKEGSAHTTDLYVISRLGKNEPLIVLDKNSGIYEPGIIEKSAGGVNGNK